MAIFPIRHVGLKLLSVAVASLLWLVVAGDPDVERTLRVGLELQRMPANLELVGTVPESVAVRVRGPAGQLSGLGASDLAVVLDLDAVREGRRTFVLTAGQVTAPTGIAVVTVTPATLPLTFEPTASKMVPVRAEIEGTPVPGHSVANVSVTPSQVRVEGPASAVARLTEVVTSPVSVEQSTSLVREAAALDLVDAGIRVAGATTAVVTVTIAADTAERTIGGVPIALRGPAPPGAMLVPAMASVTVQGAGPVVSALAAGDILLFVDVSSGSEDAPTFKVQAEASTRFVVRSIDPPTARLRDRRAR